MENVPRVVVVGAGAAGIAAVCKLYQSGLRNLTLLEGSQRIGGRICTKPFGSGIIELGAQWCHGEKDNVVFQMASVYPGLLKSSLVANDGAMMRSNGTQVPEELVERLMALAESIVESKERNTFAGSLGDFFSQQYWNKLQTDSAFEDVSRDLAEQFLVYYHNYERGYNAYDSWYEVAANESDSYVVSEGNQVLAWMGEKGFSTILDIVSGNYPGIVDTTLTPVPLDTLIKYGRFVTNIQWNATPNTTVLVTTDDGSHYEADHVIVTVSLGVLKENHQTMFTPSLPTVNLDAIRGLYFGTVNKIVILFDAPIPSDFPNTLQLLWFESDLQTLRKSEHAWTEAISTFFRIDNQPNVVAAWMNGIEGRQAELLPDETIIEGVQHILNIFANNIHFGKVQSIIRSNWSSDRHFRGSYSSRSITTERLKTGAKYLATPLLNDDGKPVVQFAGEATSWKSYSTVHGAIESGQREADRLIHLYNVHV
ncbi:peroxisomal N(1)-acetyl-spermine/spermidine oxidase-like [Anopheles ziemanni]|uniref:peroxisomal N(1)-acetyl-spermine/spermidine oxidase-like n=1 Tax=Anopheles coustani TaxID=139045 RepID=UPI00265B6A94|nr:peroxisomal N(1)-acetyl-spermine/spermidine oxidase-like [Anopheles coustani]XP_058177928.1 peroxisomal N(1)-acetyl-spermine/spermidine oxidase-like [Anopheles ziemanni]